MNLAAIVDIFQSFIPGPRLVDGGELLQLANLSFSATCGAPITALAGGGLGATTPLLSKAVNRVAVCATNADSVALPPAIPGSQLFVDNDGAATLTLFAQLSNPSNAGAADLIVAHNGLTAAAAASQTQATTVGAWYICTTLGYWKQVLGT